MSTAIRVAAEDVVRIESSLQAMREQRARLGTGPNACKNVHVEVVFPGNTRNQRFSLSRYDTSSAILAPTRDMMAIALVKAWDTMIDNEQRALANAVARLADLAKKEVSQ